MRPLPAVERIGSTMRVAAPFPRRLYAAAIHSHCPTLPAIVVSLRWWALLWSHGLASKMAQMVPMRVTQTLRPRRVLMLARRVRRVALTRL